MTRAFHHDGSRRGAARPLILAVLLAAAAPSCDIKEDRGQCPCLLTLNYSDLPSTVRDSFRARIYRGDEILSDEDVSLKSEPAVHSVRVDKGENRVCYVGGVSAETLDGDILTIPEGMDSDPVFLGSDLVMCSGESVSVDLEFRKEFCALTLEMQGGGEGGYPYGLEIEGAVAGTDIRALSPVRGRFRCVPSETGESTFSARLPRQTDSSLLLTLKDRDDGEVHIIPLGRMIRTAGYDWEKRSLDDITVSMDFASGDFTVSIADWETGSVRDVEL